MALDTSREYRDEVNVRDLLGITPDTPLPGTDPRL